MPLPRDLIENEKKRMENIQDFPFEMTTICLKGLEMHNSGNLKADFY